MYAQNIGDNAQPTDFVATMSAMHIHTTEMSGVRPDFRTEIRTADALTNKMSSQVIQFIPITDLCKDNARKNEDLLLTNVVMPVQLKLKSLFNQEVGNSP
jgi:hypothetical protein